VPADGRTRRATIGGDSLGPVFPADAASGLSDPERRAAEALGARGIAVVRFEELIPDVGLWRDLAAEVARFESDARARAPRGLDRPRSKNDYLIRCFGGASAMRDGEPVARLATTSPWLRFGACESVLNVVNAYRGLRARLVDLDAWYTIPSAREEDRVGSQRWHRDPEDLHVVKVFVYYSDVDEGAGPFQYLPGSAMSARKPPPRGPAGSLRFPWNRWRLYPREAEVERVLAASEVVTVAGRAGTVIFCDTSGLHRGGFAQKRPRLLSYHTYVAPGTAATRTFAVESEDGAGLSAVGRFALT